MRAFAYERATEPGAARREVAGAPDTMFLAGGTNLVDLMKLGVVTPDRLIDITGLGLDEIVHGDDGSMSIGATVRNSVLAADPGVRERFPLLSQALLAGASGQLRNVATTAGNLLQRTRCVYFQDTTKPCNKREGGHDPSRCPAIAGAHRDLALLGTSESCIASHPSDMAVAMAALDAAVRVTRADGTTETLGLDDVYREPGADPARDTTLAPGDLIGAVELPAVAPGARMAYRKVRDRWSYAFALVSVAAVLVADEDGRVGELRLGLGGVASRPWRARSAEQRLTGTIPAPDDVRAAVRAEFDDARALPGNAFKIDLVADTAAEVIVRLTGGGDR